MATKVLLGPPSSKDEVIKVSSFDEEFGQEENYEFDEDDFSNAKGKLRSKLTERKISKQANKTNIGLAKTNRKLQKATNKQSLKSTKAGGRQTSRISRRGTRKGLRQGIRNDQQGSRQGRKNFKLQSEQERENYVLEQELARQDMLPEEIIAATQGYDENYDQGTETGYDESLNQDALADNYDYDYQEDNYYPEDDFSTEDGGFYNETDSDYYSEDDDSGYDEQDGMYYFEGEAADFSSLNAESKGEVSAISVDQPLLDIAKKIEWHHEKMRRLENEDPKLSDHQSRISQLESKFSNFCACGGSSSADGTTDEKGVARRKQRVHLARLAARDIRTGRTKTHGGKLRAKLTKVQSDLNPDFGQNEIRIPAKTASSFEGSNASGTIIMVPWKSIGIGVAAGVVVWFGYKFIMKKK